MSVSPSSSIDDKWDINQLNEESRKFAQYFASILIISSNLLVNNYEVQMIKKNYNHLANDLDYGSKLTPFKLIRMLGLRSMPLYEHLFSIYEDSYFDWNSYFQFIVFYSCAPMVAVFYTLINTIPSFNGQVSWEDISILFQMLRRQSAVNNDVRMLFSDFDMNNDGYLSLNQFWNFIASTSQYWEPLFMFRLLLINGIFGVDKLKSMMERRGRFSIIKQYQEVHNNKLPSEPCASAFTRIIKRLPHPDKYDYDPSSIVNNQVSYISFNELVKITIRKYKPNYVFLHEAFAMKNLGRFLDHPLICDIDKYYIDYRNNSPEHIASVKRRSTLSCDKTSLTPVDFQQYSGCESSKSILKGQSHHSQVTSRSRTHLLGRHSTTDIPSGNAYPKSSINCDNVMLENGNGKIQLALNDYKNELFPPIHPVIQSQI